MGDDFPGSVRLLATRLHLLEQRGLEPNMLGKDDLAKIREEREVLDNWRTHARHVVADLLEACSVCGTVRDKDRLIHCRWCNDVYYCKEGVCAQQHHADIHPTVAFWTW
jgi:hypothetical protein